MIAKRVFYICASILSLAGANHLGARKVSAQSAVMEAPNIERYGSSDIYTFAIGHVSYGGGGPTGMYAPSAPVPGTSPIVHTSAAGIGYVAVLENGDVY